MAVQGDGANRMWTDLLRSVGTGILPGDLIFEILGRLPVESIFRFKSVSRGWYSLLTNPIFIQHHFRTAGSSAAMAKLMSLFLHIQNREGDFEFLSLVLDKSHGQLIKNLSLPFRDNVDEIRVVGSINGLVCLNLSSEAESIVLWNPAIREYFQIPKPHLVLEGQERVSLGFAYDQKTDCYKVIRIIFYTHFTTPTVPARVEIYNTRTDAWRTLMVADGFPWVVYLKTCHTVIGGAPYWQTFQSNSFSRQELLIWFDAADECFRFHQLPSYDDVPGIRRLMCVGGMGEHPVVIIYFIVAHAEILMVDSMVDIWELSGKDVLFWKKKSREEPLTGMERVLGCGRNGEIIGIDKQRSLFIYDPHPKQIEGLPFPSLRHLEVFGYIESLLSPSRLA